MSGLTENVNFVKAKISMMSPFVLVMVLVLIFELVLIIATIFPYGFRGGATCEGFGTADDGTELWLCDYYCKTAFNACSGGRQKCSVGKNNRVCTDRLTKVIKAGYRCLDFEIYNIGGVPHIGTSNSADSYSVDTTGYGCTSHTIPFAAAMAVVADKAFDASTAKADNTPLLINLRLRTDSTSVLTSISNIIREKLKDRLVDNVPEISGGTGPSVDKTPITNLIGKVVVCIHHTNQSAILEHPDLKSVANIVFGPNTSNTCRTAQYLVALAGDDQKSYMAKSGGNIQFVFPAIDRPYENNRLGVTTAMKLGGQCIGIRADIDDGTKQGVDAMFDSNTNWGGGGWAAKPTSLRHNENDEYEIPSATASTSADEFLDAIKALDGVVGTISGGAAE
jgi:hypothetical protein